VRVVAPHASFRCEGSGPDCLRGSRGVPVTWRKDRQLVERAGRSDTPDTDVRVAPSGRSPGDGSGAMKKRVVAHDRMQQGYSYYRTEPIGRHFDPLFRPELTPRQMLQLGVFGGKYMTDCRAEFPASWFHPREAVRETARSEAELLRRECLAIARDLAPKRLDS